MKGIYTVQTIPKDFQDTKYDIEYYDNPLEMVELYFFASLQDPTLAGLPDCLAADIRNLRDMYTSYCGGNINTLQAAIFFARNVSDDLIARFCDYFEGFGQFLATDSEERYNKELEENSLMIKHIVIAIDTDVVINSYCSVTVPLAYMFRSDCDVNGYLKIWPTDEKVYKIIRKLSTGEFYSVHELAEAIYGIAESVKVHPEVLLVEINSLLARQVVKAVHNGLDINIGVNHIITYLLESLLEG